jgi:hypothetical protein
MTLKPTLPVHGVFVLFTAVLFSCAPEKRIDKYIAEQCITDVPALKPKNQIPVSSALPAGPSAISKTNHKMERIIPLLFYWHFKERFDTRLNPTIAANSFANAVNSQLVKTIGPRLKDQQLELTLEKAPASFVMASKTDMVWVIYLFVWGKMYIVPDSSDLVVSYKLTGQDNQPKAGTITIKNPLHNNQGIRLFQTWRGAVNEHLTEYTANLNAMSKVFASELQKQLEVAVP